MILNKVIMNSAFIIENNLRIIGLIILRSLYAMSKLEIKNDNLYEIKILKNYMAQFIFNICR